MSEGRMHGCCRQRMEERIAEIRYRLAMEEACGKAAVGGVSGVPGLLEMEEELLAEAARLERILAAGEYEGSRYGGPCSEDKKG